MAGIAAVARRRAGTSEAIATLEELDTRPPILDFPEPASRIKDLNLAVLLGRQVKCDYSMREYPVD